jgi:uroporphyrinogen decarboxylase
MQLKNDLIIRAAKGEYTERVPVWMMRQAGRILPEYRAVRNSLSGFKELVETPELAAEVTLQPVDILGVDAAIIFSDILVVPEAMGLPYQMIEKKGPWFEKTLRTSSSLKDVCVPDVGTELKYVTDAISICKKELNGKVPLIGFAGAPWTIFCYMTEGEGSKTFSTARKLLFTEQHFTHQLLEMITKTTIAYLNAQVKAGADMVQLFDSWAGVLSPSLYKRFVIPYLAEICNSFTGVPITLFSKGAYFARQDLSLLNCNTIGLDWNMDPMESRNIIGWEKTLQGNLDPAVLYADEEIIVKETEKMLKSFGNKRYIANLGHGVYPDTEASKAKLFIDTVKNFKN